MEIICKDRVFTLKNGGDVLLPIYPREALGGAALRDSLPELVVELPDTLSAPIRWGEVLGKARMVVHGETVAETELIAGADVARDDFPSRFRHYLTLWLNP